jgi:NCAIR mutase (PurE)-related protein
VIRDRAIEMLRRVRDGELAPERAADELAFAPAESLGFATIDHNRALRQGYPEVILGLGKTAEQVLTIAERLAEKGEGFLVTRADATARELLAGRFPEVEVNELGRAVYLAPDEPLEPYPGVVALVTAGTADLPVAEEAAVTARAFRSTVARITDVGVAGLHRVLAKHAELHASSVVIVVAGMDGALPSVVGGLVRCPVIAVPTSVGYGASYEGIGALLAMLNSCAAGLTVVNIDNGFGAAVAAARILSTLADFRPE